jgi:hypothetical protein
MKIAVAALLLLATTPRPLAELEERYLDLLELHDRIEIAESRGVDRGSEGTPLAELRARYAKQRRALVEDLKPIEAARLEGEDQKALDAIHHVFGYALREPDKQQDAPQAAGAPDCKYDPAALLAGPEGLETLQEKMYACYSDAARHIPFEGAVYDRLTILEMAGREATSARRQQIFMALEPLFRSVNGDGGATSPYRVMVQASAAKWKAEGSPIDRNLTALGIAPAKLEPWLVSILEAWRDAARGQELEPWDYEYSGNAAGRALADRITAARLRPLNDAFYASLGADIAALNIHYDLESREGKTAVAFTNFGARPRFKDGRWTPGEPWIFATYGAGGLGNLGELLHETGHAIHIAAIHTRPAFTDWPDSDTFTEALADLVALDAYDAAWQRKYLGAEASLADNLRTKYSGIVLDVAWGLFELRMHRDPGADPNAVWTDLTSRYLHVKPHPEFAWWARRGQLVDGPGYMMNYALGAILVADMRAHCLELKGSFTAGDPGYYAWLTDKIYRFGLGKTSGDVIRDFLGRAPAPDAIIKDMRRTK